MSDNLKRVIYVGPADGGDHRPLNTEGLALDADIQPGMALKQAATGFNKLGDAATVFGNPLIIADKDQQRTRQVTELWTQNENMVALVAEQGKFYNVLVAAGNNITRRDTPLSSNADGTLKIAVTPATVGATSEEVVAYADEIINVTGSAALVRVRAA